MNKLYKFKSLASIAAVLFIAGCAGGAGTYGGSPAYGLGSAAGSSVGGGVQGAVLNAIVQSMASSVLNGQIGSQLAPVDQNFRLQQLGQAVQYGTINQAQQWVNPQTGNIIMLKPGQQIINPQNRQKCINMVETLVLKNGRKIFENRRACQDPITGKWKMVQ